MLNRTIQLRALVALVRQRETLWLVAPCSSHMYWDIGKVREFPLGSACVFHVNQTEIISIPRTDQIINLDFIFYGFRVVHQPRKPKLITAF